MITSNFQIHEWQISKYNVPSKKSPAQLKPGFTRFTKAKAEASAEPANRNVVVLHMLLRRIKASKSRSIQVENEEYISVNCNSEYP